jgi:hypothetical protein
MNETVIVGALVLSGAVALWLHQMRTQASIGPEDAWLYTQRRHRRRMAIAMVLGLLGAMILASGTDLMPLDPTPDGQPRLGNLITFVVGGLTLSTVLLLLAFLDFRETTRAAARHAIHELTRDPNEGNVWTGEAEGPAGEDRAIPTTKSSNRLRRAPDPTRREEP